VTSTTYLLLEKYRDRWQELLTKSSKARPLRVPSALAVGRVADVSLTTKYGPSRLRVAAVSPSGEWIDVSDGWPVAPEPEIIEWRAPEPGPGMVPEGGQGFVWPASAPPALPDESLTPADVPPADADWSRIMWFASSMDGYEEWGSFENLAPLANAVSAYWDKTQEIVAIDLRALRACLFFEHRRHHHFGHPPDAQATAYIRALIERIREFVTSMRTSP
jgi:hypothetical protein